MQKNGTEAQAEKGFMDYPSSFLASRGAFEQNRTAALSLAVDEAITFSES